VRRYVWEEARHLAAGLLLSSARQPAVLSVEFSVGHKPVTHYEKIPREMGAKSV
jgi:hypothetical protein